MTWQLFALERYDDSGRASILESMSLRSTADASLIAMVYLPADEVVLALVEAPDEQAAAAAAAASGWRVDRLNAAAWIKSAPNAREKET